VRDRYRQELLAELHDLDRREQLHHAVGVLSRAWSLRRAVAGSPAVDVMALPAPETPPLHCRWHLYHHYWLASTDDGHRYQRCRECGLDSPAIGNGPGDWVSPMGMRGWN